MSDVMLFGVLRMPIELAMDSELSRIQFYGRAQEAADRIEQLERELAEARKDAMVAAQAGQVDQECGCCGGSGWMVRDPDIGTDQECTACDGTGKYYDFPPAPVSAIAIVQATLEAAANVCETNFENEWGVPTIVLNCAKAIRALDKQAILNEVSK